MPSWVHEYSVSTLAREYPMSFAAVQKHVAVLERAGLVRREVRGRVHLCRLDTRPLRSGLEWLRYYEQFWTDRLDVLEAVLRAEDARTIEPRRSRKRKP